MEVLYLVKILGIECSPHLHFLRSPESKRWFWESVCAYMYVRICVYAITSPKQKKLDQHIFINNISWMCSFGETEKT